MPEQILYDRMRTVFNREDPETSHIVYNRTLLAFARHYGYLPKACKAYRAKTKACVSYYAPFVWLTVVGTRCGAPWPPGLALAII